MYVWSLQHVCMYNFAKLVHGSMFEALMRVCMYVCLRPLSVYVCMFETLMRVCMYA